MPQKLELSTASDLEAFCKLLHIEEHSTQQASELGQLLRRLRHDCGLTLQDLGDETGYSHTTVRRWELGNGQARVPRVLEYFFRSKLGGNESACPLLDLDFILDLIPKVNLISLMATDSFYFLSEPTLLRKFINKVKEARHPKLEIVLIHPSPSPDFFVWANSNFILPTGSYHEIKSAFDSSFIPVDHTGETNSGESSTEDYPRVLLRSIGIPSPSSQYYDERLLERLQTVATPSENSAQEKKAASTVPEQKAESIATEHKALFSRWGGALIQFGDKGNAESTEKDSDRTKEQIVKDKITEDFKAGIRRLIGSVSTFANWMRVKYRTQDIRDTGREADLFLALNAVKMTSLDAVREGRTHFLTLQPEKRSRAWWTLTREYIIIMQYDQLLSKTLTYEIRD